MKNPVFDPHKSLLELGIIRWAAVILLFAILIVIFTITNNGNFYWKPDYHGLNAAVEIFRIPLGIAALSIPIMAILAANHRSEQSREQMRLTGQQNIFSNHYKHIEEFEKYCIRFYERMMENDQRMKESYKNAGGLLKMLASESFIYSHVDPQNSRFLYKQIYPRSAQGDMAMSSEFIESIDLFVTEMFNIFKYFKSDSKPDWYLAVTDLNALVLKFSNKNYVDLHGVPGTKNLRINNVDISIPGGDVMNLVRRLHDVLRALEQVLSFDISYVASPMVLRALSANLETLPKCYTDNNLSWEPIDVSALIEENRQAVATL